MFVRDRKGHTEAQGRRQVKTEAETAVMLPQAEEQHQEPPEAGRGKAGFSPGVSGGTVAPPSP